MRYNPRKIAIILLFIIMASLVLVSAVPAEVYAAIPPAANSTPSRMEVAVYVNSIDNLDFVKGTYSIDFYLHFRWTDPAIQTAHFELMNGQPSSEPHALEKLSESKSGPVKEEWYRVRADFTIIPNIRNYPFESGITPIEIEDAENDETQLVYVPLVNDSGIEPRFSIPGWTVGKPTFSTVDHAYPWGRTYSQLSFDIPITKNATDSLIQTIIPPVIFCLIAMLSFFISVEHNELVHLRYVLTTTMFISAVMYHFSQLSLLPGLGVLKLFDKFMIAVYLFLAVTIAVTTLCYLAQQQWGRQDLVKPINDFGVVVSIILPVLTFWLLLVLI